MSRIKSFLLGVIAICTSTLSYSQQVTEPAKCKNPGGGILSGGAFTVSPVIGCLDLTSSSATTYVSNPLSPTGGLLTDLGYIYNFKDGQDIKDFSPAQPFVTSAPGTYWILQGGNSNGNAYVTCNSFEVIKTTQPDISVSSCGANVITITFLPTDNNKQHTAYRIVWGDGNQDFIPNITPASFPFDKSHTYAPGTQNAQPQIVGSYTRGSRADLCPSTPYKFNFEANSKPRISELEGLNGGESDKITMVEGSDGKAYTLEQKPKGGNWADTGKKITRASGAASANETITGLNPANEYCFRLKTTDGCNNQILSNEVCTIIPKATIISSKKATIDWNTLDPAVPAVVRYTINYKESPSGANPNTASPVTPTATTYTFDALDCTKKYDFGITAYLGTTNADRVLIKSPTVLVDPSKTPKLPPKTIGTVSVLNNTVIKFNIYEAGDKASKYVFYRSEGGPNNFVKVKEFSENFFDDQNVEPDKQQYCYKVEYQDACGNSSEPSPAFCSVFLTSVQPNVLNWTPFVIPSPNTFPVDYYVETVDANGNTTTVDVTPDTKLSVKAQIDIILDNINAQGKANFRIRAVQKVQINIGGNLISFPFDVYSNIYTFITPAQIYVPTAFSPNDDGNNDTFVAKGRFIVEFNLEVYDRWGNVIFESKDLETGWNGTASDGQTPAPPGNYGFRLYGLDPAGQKFEKIGSVTLIR